MINIESDFPFPTHLLERAAQATLAWESASLLAKFQEQAPGLQTQSLELSIILTDEARLQELNLNYLGIDAPTDVLSFPASETDPETGARYIGDILISLPRAQAQADAAGHPLEAEVQLLVVHGVLHLLGHDHAQAEEKARMWQAQAEVLERLGLGHIQIREE
jgi:probable rRNA maturation factor